MELRAAIIEEFRSKGFEAIDDRGTRNPIIIYKNIDGGRFPDWLASLHLDEESPTISASLRRAGDSYNKVYRLDEPDSLQNLYQDIERSIALLIVSRPGV